MESQNHGAGVVRGGLVHFPIPVASGKQVITSSVNDCGFCASKIVWTGEGVCLQQWSPGAALRRSDEENTADVW